MFLANTLPSSAQRYGAERSKSSLSFRTDLFSLYMALSITGSPTTSSTLNTGTLPNLCLLNEVDAFDVMDNRLTPGEMNASPTNLRKLNVETIYCDNGDDGNMHYANQGNLFDISALGPSQYLREKAWERG